MHSLRPFQIILLGVFFALALGGVILFALFRGFSGGANQYGASVEIWGTLSERAFRDTVLAVSKTDEDFRVVSYVAKDPRTFQADLVAAVAEGRGPDAIVLPSDLLLSERAKLFPIPYETLPLRDIKDRYTLGAEIFALRDGLYGFPIAVDPLVMYWDRDLLASAGLAAPPTTWEAVVDQAVPALRRVSGTFAVDQAALAFGEYANVENATETILLLLLQAGSPLITEGEDGRYSARINDAAVQTARRPAEAALDFYTQFANPAGPLYTWNRSLPRDREAFLAEKLALYFGFGSEYPALRAGNANLNFDAAQVPQSAGATIKKGYGRFYALSLLKTSDNFEGTYRALARLGDEANTEALAKALGLAPATRTALASPAGDPVAQTLYTAALTARGFLNPAPAATDGIMQTMIEDVTSGRVKVSEAAQDAADRFSQLLSR